MPQLIPTKQFLKEMEGFRSNAIVRKKIAKALALLEVNPLHPGLHLERIVNDLSAWSARVDGHYHLSFDPGGCLPANASQVEIAHRLNISYQVYQRFENPCKANPTLKTVEKIAGVFGKHVELGFV